LTEPLSPVFAGVAGTVVPHNVHGQFRPSGVGVLLGVYVHVGVFVAVLVGVLLGVLVAVFVGVSDGVLLGVNDGVFVKVAVGTVAGHVNTHGAAGFKGLKSVSVIAY
jgi:hypothetical protein